MMEKSTKCLVTGGAGFIGSHLCDALISKGYEVFCVDDLITGSKKNIAHLLDNPHFHFILHDITKPISSASTVSRLRRDEFKYIYHLASPASPPQYRKYSIETLLTNSIGTYKMLELARTSKAIFLFASTSEIYGNPQEHPQKESYYGNVNPVGPRACYDEGKRFAEALTMEYVRRYKLAATVVRIFNTYGPRMQKKDGRVIPNFINQALTSKPLTVYGDGRQTRSFCFISDMVEGLIAAVEKEVIEGQVINLGNPDEKRIIDIGKLILQLTCSNSKFIYLKKRPEGDPDRRKPDITKAKKLLDWQPKVSFEEGLRRTIDYFVNL